MIAHPPQDDAGARRKGIALLPGGKARRRKTRRSARASRFFLETVASAPMRMSEWIEPALVQAFAAEQTDAYRLCTCDDGWVERYGSDVLVSYKTEAARERLTTEFCRWSLSVEFKFTRIFARFLPRQNAQRAAPKLILGDAGLSLRSIATERRLHYGIDFESGYSIGLFIDQRENRSYVRSLRPKTLLNCFAYTCSFSVGGGDGRRKDGQRGSFKKIARARARKFRPERADDERSSVHRGRCDGLPPASRAQRRKIRRHHSRPAHLLAVAPREGVPSRAGFRNPAGARPGSGGTGWQDPAFDELHDAARTGAESNGAFLPEGGPTRRHPASRAAAAGFSAGDRGEHRLADFALIRNLDNAASWPII